MFSAEQEEAKRRLKEDGGENGVQDWGETLTGNAKNVLQFS